jgi:hypothetical protein
MSIDLHTERKFAGFAEDGGKLYSVTFHSHPAAPQSVAQWVAIKVAGLGGLAGWGSGKAVAELLQADDDQAVQAALAGAKGLDEWERWGVLQGLQALRESADSGYAPAVRHVAERIEAWTGRYGAAKPHLRAGERIGGEPLPAEGTGQAKPRFGCAPVSR